MKKIAYPHLDVPAPEAGDAFIIYKVCENVVAHFNVHLYYNRGYRL